MNNAAKLIEVFQLLLEHLEAIVKMMPQLLGEDDRSENLKNKISSYQTKLAGVKTVLRQHREHERRNREIQRRNKQH